MKKKLIIVFGIIFVFFAGIFLFYYQQFNNAIPILAYHAVVENPTKETDVSIKNFQKQMSLLKKLGYKTLSLDEFYEFKNGKKINGKKILLTFDDGDKSFYTNVLPILNDYNFKAVNFVINDALNKDVFLSKKEIDDILNKNSNINIQSHSYNLHDEKSAKSNDYNIYNNDMKLNSKNNYQYYAYPFGISNDNYIKALKDNNYKMAFLFSPSKWASRDQDNYLITRVPIYNSNSLLKFFLKISIKL